MDRPWTRLQEAFEGARSLTPGARRAFLLDRLGADEEAIVRVEAMLRADAVEKLPIDRRLQTLADTLLEEGPPTPERIGPYRIVGTLGRGGMGVVYRGERPDLERADAIKVLYGTSLSPMRHQMFLREQRLLASLRHPSIAQIHDAGTLEDGTPYFVMEEVAGLPLDEAADRRCLDLNGRLALFRRVCDAVQHAHTRGVIHSDLKMSNLIVSVDDETPAVKLLDFGIARRLGEQTPADDTAIADADVVAYTPAYAAPEQVGGAPATMLTDVYALGVLLYELLARRRPRPAGGRVNVAPDPLSPPSSSERQVHATRFAWRELDAICARALALDPEDRYPSVDALAEDLRRFEDHRPVEALGPSPGYVARKFARRHRISVATAAAFLLLLLGTTVTVFVQSRSVAAERDIARRERAAAEQVSSFMLDMFRASDPAHVRGEDLLARDLLDNAAATVLRPGASHPADQVRFVYAITRAYDHLGLYEEQETLLRAALETEGVEHRTVPPSATVLRAELAGALLQLGRLDDAESVLEEASEIAGRTPSIAALDRLAIDSKLAHLRWAQGRLDESEKIFLRVIPALEKEGGGERSQRYYESLSNLGAVYSHQGRFEEAGELYERAIEALTGRVGSDHPRTLLHRGNLATLLLRQQSYERARELLIPLLEDKRRVLGERHADTLRSVNGLAIAEHQLGHLDAAEELFREALAVSEDTLPPGHRETLGLLGNLAAVLGDRGELEEARAFHVRVYEGFRSTLGERHQYTALGLHNLAGADAALGHLDEADRQYARTHGIWTETLPADHPYLAMNDEAWSAVQRRLGHLARAEELAERARRIRASPP